MKTDRIKKISLCCLLGVFAEVFTSCTLSFILTAIPGAATQYVSEMSSLFEDNLVLILRVALLMPIVEELIFRLFLFGALKRIMPVIAANLIQAMMFGIYHGKLVQGIYAFLLGLFLGLLKDKTRTIFATIGFHCLFNITGLLLEEYMPVDIPVAIRTGIMLAALAICVFLYFGMVSDRVKAQTS
ncbi:MAG: CPBP family intramembrane metalloprotease [Lachnospiraceae bacterium]|nr:CPBP family intramembrane metalloprotease [Lachnospiraceae bacterium]